MPLQSHGPGSPSTTTRPPVMYSNAKPLQFARAASVPRRSFSGAGGLAAEHHVGARQADARAGVGVALDQEQAALGAVGEALAHVAADPLAARVLRLQHLDLAAEGALADAVLRAAEDPDAHALQGERRQAAAGRRALGEREVHERRRCPLPLPLPWSHGRAVAGGVAGAVAGGVVAVGRWPAGPPLHPGVVDAGGGARDEPGEVGAEVAVGGGRCLLLDRQGGAGGEALGGDLRAPGGAAAGGRAGRSGACRPGR